MLCAIPIEILARELDGVLYLALHLAARGLPTLIGERMVDRIVRRARQPVIYFDSDQNPDVNDAVLATGGRVINLNGEGLAPLDGPEPVANFLKIAPHVSRICAWGEVSAQALRQGLPEDRQDLVTVTGYHSFDLAKEKFWPYYRDADIVRRHGEGYLLINTNFNCNHAMGLERYIKMLASMPEWGVYANPAYVEFRRNIAKYQANLIGPFVDMARHLARTFPERHLIIRPHPSEYLGFYLHALRGLPNVFVERAGSVRRWIASAAAVIHHDCTTGAETLLMGKPLIRFQPILDTTLTAPMLWQLGKQARTPEEVAEIVGQGPFTAQEQEAQLDILRPYFANIEGLACRKLADMAAAYAAESGGSGWVPRPVGLWEGLKAWRKHLSKLLRAQQPGHNGRKVRYALNKFRSLPQAEVLGRLDRLRALEPGLPRVAVERLALHTYLIRPAD